MRSHSHWSASKFPPPRFRTISFIKFRGSPGMFSDFLQSRQNMQTVSSMNINLRIPTNRIYHEINDSHGTGKFPGNLYRKRRWIRPNAGYCRMLRADCIRKDRCAIWHWSCRFRCLSRPKQIETDILPVAVGKDKPGPGRLASLSGSGKEKSSSPALRSFSFPAPAPRAYEPSRGNRSVRDRKPHNLLFIACTIDKIKIVRASKTWDTR